MLLVFFLFDFFWFFFSVLLFFFVCGLFFFWQGFLRATSLGPTPSSIVCVVCFSSLSFFSLWFLSDPLFLMEKPCFPSPQTKGITGLPLFHFLFLCLSALLIFFPSFLSFLLSSFLLPAFVCFFLFLSSLLLFHGTNNIRMFDSIFFLHHSSLVLLGFDPFSNTTKKQTKTKKNPKSRKKI